MNAHLHLPLMVVAALGSAAMVRAGQPAATNAADPRITTGRTLSQQFGAELKAALELALAEKGPAAAIVVCRDEAPRIAARLSAERGVTVARTALRVRNPSNAPQPWQRAALGSFEKRLAGGEKVEALESFEAQPDGSARYLKAIGTAPLCVVCHGEAIAPDILHVLKEHYPQDQATGFKVGDLRGAFSIAWPSVKRASTASLLLHAAASAADLASVREQEYAGIRNAFCPKAEPAAPPVAKDEPADLYIEPVRVFDNLYFVGDRSTSAWALTTDQGIILLDAGFHHNVESTIVGGLKKLGLNPADIEYVIVSHGHNDHFGGARFLQATYGARIVLSEADWSHMVTWPQRGSPAPFPDRDILVKDGDVITLGTTSVRIVVTPGHTPGTISPIFKVKDGKQTHVVGYWGGDGAGHLPPKDIETYMRSADRFMSLDPAVDVELSNHVVADGTLLRLPLLKERRPGDPHPFVSGNVAFREWVGVLKSCAGAFLPRQPAP